MAHTIEFAAALILMIPGVAMAFVPVLPALVYMFLVSLAFGFVDGFDSLSANELFVLLGIALVSVVVDHVSGLLGAKLGGAHSKSLLWGMAGAILGTFFLPALGSFAGLFLGVLAGEVYYKKTGTQAFKAASSALAGSALGVAANVALSLAFLSAFFFFVLG